MTKKFFFIWAIFAFKIEISMESLSSPNNKIVNQTIISSNILNDVESSLEDLDEKIINDFQLMLTAMKNFQQQKFDIVQLRDFSNFIESQAGLINENTTLIRNRIVMVFNKIANRHKSIMKMFDAEIIVLNQYTPKNMTRLLNSFTRLQNIFQYMFNYYTEDIPVFLDFVNIILTDNVRMMSILDENKYKYQEIRSSCIEHIQKGMQEMRDSFQDIDKEIDSETAELYFSSCVRLRDSFDSFSRHILNEAATIQNNVNFEVCNIPKGLTRPSSFFILLFLEDQSINQQLHLNIIKKLIESVEKDYKKNLTMENLDLHLLCLKKEEERIKAYLESRSIINNPILNRIIFEKFKQNDEFDILLFEEISNIFEVFVVNIQMQEEVRVSLSNQQIMKTTANCQQNKKQIDIDKDVNPLRRESEKITEKVEKIYFQFIDPTQLSKVFLTESDDSKIDIINIFLQKNLYQKKIANDSSELDELYKRIEAFCKNVKKVTKNIIKEYKTTLNPFRIKFKNRFDCIKESLEEYNKTISFLTKIQTIINKLEEQKIRLEKKSHPIVIEEVIQVQEESKAIEISEEKALEISKILQLNDMFTKNPEEISSIQQPKIEQNFSITKQKGSHYLINNAMGHLKGTIKPIQDDLKSKERRQQDFKTDCKEKYMKDLRFFK